MQLCSLLYLVGTFAATSIVAANSPGRCPEVRSDFGGICVEQCSSDVDCARHQKCCSNGCGHVCTEATTQPEMGHHYCPPVDANSTGLCAEECLADDQCEWGKRCCSNGCGHACATPVGPPLALKPGRCPELGARRPPSSVGICSEECLTDGDCADRAKCCGNGCGHACTEPIPAPESHKPGHCPATGSVMGVCSEECSSDGDCSGDRKCCSNGCGHACTEPIPAPTESNKPGHCPATASAVVGVCSEECSSDGDCSGDRKCCSTGCGHACTGQVGETGQRPVGHCPNPDNNTDDGADCRDECSSDDDCTNSRRCCSNGCGYVCVDATAQTPHNTGCQLDETFYQDGDAITATDRGCEECRCSAGEVKCTIPDNCRTRVSFMDTVRLVLFSTIGITMAVFLIFLFAKCFLYKPEPRKYKLMHDDEVPEFEPVSNATNGHIL